MRAGTNAVAAARGLIGVARGHPVVVDAALGMTVAGLYLLVMTIGPAEANFHLSIGSAALAALVALVAITVRRQWPVPVLLGAGAASLAFTVVDQEQPVLMAVLVISSYTVASGTNRRTALRAVGALALVVYAAGVIWSRGQWWVPRNLGTLAWIGMATAFGDATRSRRAYIAAIEERARRAEQTRDEEARRRVAEERLRIARELHDVVAHHIAVINVQAGAAAYLLDEQPEQVGPALARIRHASDTVVKELASVVGVLRQPDDVSTEPVRGLARLGDLLGTLAASGLPVRRRQLGRPRELPAMVDLAAYRIVQEALTNAHKHGTGGAGLTISYEPHTVTVEITNPVSGHRPRSGTSGYGIVGMRERATAAGGIITVSQLPDSEFVVRATLPTEVRP